MRRILVSILALLALPVLAQHNGTIVGAPTFGAAKFGNGLISTSDSNYVTTPNGSFPVNTATFTAEAQLKTTSTKFEVAVTFTDGTNDLWIGVKSGKLSYTFGAEADTTVTINDGAWHHVEVDCSAGSCQAYIDGVSAAGGALTTGNALAATVTGYLGRYRSAGYAWTGSIDEVAGWSSVRHTSGFTPPAAAYSGSETGLVSLYHLQADGTDSKGAVPPTTTIAPNNAAILYSPYNWTTAAGYARTINAGAYFRTIFSGTSAVLTTDTSADASPYPRLACRVDSQAWVFFTLAASNPNLTVATGLASRSHLLECIVEATSEFVTRWQASPQSLVSLTGLVLDASATVTAPVRRTKNILAYGDSITECYKTLSSATTPDGSSAINCYSRFLMDSEDAEVGIVAFGGTGITVAGVGGVPALPSSYNLLYPGVSRVFTPTPDLIIFNEGENDNTANIVSAYTTLSQALLSALPSTKQLLLIPFSQREAANVQATVTAVASPLVSYVPTSGWFNSADSSDGQHPYGYSSYGLIGPKLPPFINAVLYPATGRGVTFF